MLEIVEKFSYFGLFLILFIEEGGIPLPVPGDIFIATVSALPNSNSFSFGVHSSNIDFSGSCNLLASCVSARDSNKHLISFMRNPTLKICSVTSLVQSYLSILLILSVAVLMLASLSAELAVGTYAKSHKNLWSIKFSGS